MPIKRTVEPIAAVRTCPFCGKVPTIRHSEYNRKSTQWEDDWQVSCENTDCDVKPKTKQYYSKELSIAVWNNRFGDSI